MYNCRSDESGFQVQVLLIRWHPSSQEEDRRHKELMQKKQQEELEKARKLAEQRQAELEKEKKLSAERQQEKKREQEKLQAQRWE